jgi:VanZ family protein
LSCLASYLALVIYGSLVPLNFTARSLEEIHLIVSVGIASTFAGLSRTDFGANVLMFVPVGFLGAGMLLADTVRRAWRTIEASFLVMWLACAVGAALESAQLFIPDRTFSVSDVVAQALGTSVGIAFWILLGGPINVWLRSLPRARGMQEATSVPRKPGYARDAHHLWSWPCAFAWIVFLALQQWSPFDFRSDPQFVRMRLEELPVVPFENYYYSPLPLAFAELTRKLLLGIPLGILLAPTRRVKAQQTSAALLGIAATLSLVEAGQLFVPSRTPDPTDVIIQTAGAFAGWWGFSLVGVFPAKNSQTETKVIQLETSRRSDGGGG